MQSSDMGAEPSQYFSFLDGNVPSMPITHKESEAFISISSAARADFQRQRQKGMRSEWFQREAPVPCFTKNLASDRITRVISHDAGEEHDGDQCRSK